jgi:phosphinothricin acetyltransferase
LRFDERNFHPRGGARRPRFRAIGTFDPVGFKFGRWFDSVLMQRALGRGATTAPSRPGGN